jgi:hypothetical protein
MNDFLALFKEGFRLAWNLGQLALENVKAVVLAYFLGVKKWSIRFIIAAVAPLVVIVPCLAFHAPFGALYGAYAVWLSLLFVAELILITPMILVWRRLKALFPTVAHDLGDWVDFIKSVLFNGLSLGIFVTLFPIWRSPGAFPLLLLVLACWLMLPACAFSSFCRRIYPAVQGIQLLFLAALLVLQMSFPRHLEQVKWAMARWFGNTLTGLVEQKETTADWKTMQWFSNTGEPLVWYSGSDSESYRLWAAPGFDPNSGKELGPVKDAKTREEIVSSLSERDRGKRVRMAEDQAEVTRRATQSAEALAASQRAAYLARYLESTNARKGVAKQLLAVVVVSEDGKLNSAVAQTIAGALKTELLDATTAPFTPEFVADGLFAEVFRDPHEVLSKLALTNYLSALLFARQTVNYSTNIVLENIITANMRLEVLTMPTTTLRQSETRVITASGVGFRQRDARSQAELNLSKMIPRETDSLRSAIQTFSE